MIQAVSTRLFTNFVAANCVCALWRHNMAADIPFMEVTERKDVQNGGRSILKMTPGFGLFSSLSKVKIYFFLLFTSNLSYSNSFKLPHKIQLLGFCSPLIHRNDFLCCNGWSCNSSQKCLMTKLEPKTSNIKVRPKLHLEIQSYFFLFLFLREAGGWWSQRGKGEEGSEGCVKPK